MSKISLTSSWLNRLPTGHHAHISRVCHLLGPLLKISTQWVLQLQYSHHKGTWWINGLFSCWFLLDKFKGAFDKALSGKVRDDFRTTWSAHLNSSKQPLRRSLDFQFSWGQHQHRNYSLSCTPAPTPAWLLWSTQSSSCCVFFIFVWIYTFWIRFSKLLFTKNNLF